MEPYYCPRCGSRKPEATDDSLCEHCGERLARQSYCPVCERFWCEPVGTPCPKHEIPLERAAVAGPGEMVAGSPWEWVTVARFESVAVVQAPRIRLESEGIPTFLDGERMGTMLFNNPALGGVRLLVPREFADQARLIVNTFGGPSGIRFDDDLDDAFEDLAPEPGARRRTVMRVMILLILFLPPLWALFETLVLGFLRR